MLCSFFQITRYKIISLNDCWKTFTYSQLSPSALPPQKSTCKPFLAMGNIQILVPKELGLIYEVLGTAIQSPEHSHAHEGSTRGATGSAGILHNYKICMFYGLITPRLPLPRRTFHPIHVPQAWLGGLCDLVGSAATKMFKVGLSPFTWSILSARPRGKFKNSSF